MSTQTSTETAELRRDVRVDQIGFCNELEKRYAKTLIASVKLKMAADVVEKVQGDYFEGLLVRAMERTVDPANLLKLLTQKKITVAQFLSAITVQIKPCTAFLSGDQINAMSDSAPATPKLLITRKKGVEILLVDVVKGLGAAIGEAKP